jgi:RNA polymerase sigma-70 factor (ECF subfamily)
MQIAIAHTRAAAQTSHLAAGSVWSDDRLIAHIAARHTLGMRMLFARHQLRVYRFVLRIVRDEQLAEDVVSEVFLQVWRQADQFQGRCAVSTWLLSIARNVAITTLRRNTTVELDDKTAGSLVDHADDPERSTVTKEIGSLIRHCLTRLSPSHREIIDLVYYHDMAVDEVAEILGIPASTVKTRMFYARSQLRRLLAQTGIKEAA